MRLPWACIAKTSEVFYYHDKIRARAPVAQWIERRPPEPKAAVRARAGALDQNHLAVVFLLSQIKRRDPLPSAGLQLSRA